MDRWDAIGGAGALLLGAGIGARCGWPWALIVWGALLLSVYVLREVKR